MSSSDAAFLSRPGARSSRSLAIVGAAGVISLELIVLALTGFWDARLVLGVVVLSAYAMLCWASPRSAWLLALACVPLSREMLVPLAGSALWVPSEPMILVFLAIWAMRVALRGSHSLPRSRLLSSVAILGLIVALSGLQSLYPVLSFKAISNAAWYVAFGLVYPYLHGRDDEFLRRACWIVGAWALFFALYGLVFVATHGVARWTGNAMGRPFFPDHGTYSVFLSFGLAYWVYIAFSTRNTLGRATILGAAATVMLAVILSLARAAFLGLAGLFAALLWHLIHAGRARLALTVVLVGGLAFAGLRSFRAEEFIGLHAASISQPGEISNLGRISRWLAGWNMVRDRPWLGVGYGAYVDSYFSYRVITLKTEDKFIRSGVHSEYLKILSETGWIGFLALFWLVMTLFRESSFAIHRAPVFEDRWMALAALAGLSSYLVHGVFNNYIETDKAALPFWLSVAMIAILGRRIRRPAVASPCER